MLKKLVLLFVCALFLFVSVVQAMAQESSWQLVSNLEFVPSNGDYLIVGVNDGIGYLVNDESKTFTAFTVLSGQRRNVCYIGRCYFAATPEQEWLVKEENIQGDKITFSKSGEFLRLYAGGEERTSYGIHGHAYFDEMIKKDTYFQSMGCLIVADAVLDVIQGSFAANDKSLRVLTTDELDLTKLLKVVMSG